ncbi:MBL fold metallo-hydrolase [Lentibacillus halophilus]|uniref:MBL fold metallo-hydrolase n=1 Tax=Lentibacillus halophilus TaxID=295065 RepID=A0ABN0Z891_9BACI
MKLTVIGFWGAYPAQDSATSAYLLEKDGFNLLVDAGSGSLSKLQKQIHVMDLDAVILSHYHSDHAADIGVLQHAWLVQSYLTGQKGVLPIYGHTDDNDHFRQLSHKFTEGVSYDPDTELVIGPFSITFLKTIHPVPCYGMRITDGDTTIVYTADTAFMDTWMNFAKDADLLITDCNFYADQNGSVAGHMTSEEGASIAEGAHVGELLLSHLPHYRNTHDLIDEAGVYFSGDIYLAREGLTWEKNNNF